jgi:hypothetical protein
MPIPLPAVVPTHDSLVGHGNCCAQVAILGRVMEFNLAEPGGWLSGSDRPLRWPTVEVLGRRL